ncbi:MAG: hypothetical protein E7527_01350 [Ruminococcaceae bacterium]|nr:hypothetical protein [Oscillospiraceae bacterium]
MKKQSGHLALAGVLSALALVLLLFTYIPTATVALAALAAVCGIPVVVELGHKAGLVHYATVAALAALLALTAEGTGLYLAFFGWYTVLKAYVESRNFPRVAEWAVKLGAFTLAIAAYGAVWVLLLQMPLPTWFAWWMLAPFGVAAEAVFVVYDLALTGVVTTYHQRIRPKIRGLFRF